MKKVWVGVLIAGTILAAGKGGNGGGNGAGAAGLSLRVVDETIPAGATVQAKIESTEPQPIITGHSRFSLDAFEDVFGVALSSPDGLTIGTAVRDAQGLQFRVVSPTGSFGTDPDYPIMVVAGRVKSTAQTGASLPMNISGLEFRDPAGAVYPMEVQQGTLTVGGTLSVHDIIPGGGLQPAGTVIRILGTGFDPGVKVNSSPASLRDTRFISSNEIQVTLRSAADLHGNRFRIINPRNVDVTYYSYFRPVYDKGSSSDLLNRTKALYSQATYSRALLPAGAPPLSTAFAFQNISDDPVPVNLELLDVFGQVLATRSITVPAGTSLSRTVAETFARTDGASVRATAKQNLQMLGLMLDASADTAIPVAPVPAP